MFGNTILIALAVIALVAVVASSWRGNARPVSVQVISMRPLAEVRAIVITRLLTTFTTYRFDIAAQSPTEITLVRKYRPGIVWILTIVFFPFGLVFFFAGARRNNASVMLAERTGGGTTVIITGLVPGGLARKLAAIADEPAAELV